MFKANEQIYTYLQDGLISAGHLAALLPLPEDQQKILVAWAISEKWSIKKVEKMVKRFQKASEIGNLMRIERELSCIHNMLKDGE